MFQLTTGEPKVKKGKQLQPTSTIENEGDEDLPDDAEKELPGDQEYSAKGEPSQEDEEDDDIEQDIPERTLNRQSGESDPKLPGNKKMKKRELINTVVNVRIASDLERMRRTDKRNELRYRK